jgi:hypothetical protein
MTNTNLTIQDRLRIFAEYSARRAGTINGSPPTAKSNKRS